MHYSLLSSPGARTNFHSLKPGSVVNLEFDIIGKYLSRMTNLLEE